MNSPAGKPLNLARIAKRLCNLTQEMASLLEEVITTTQADDADFIPTVFQHGILRALDGVALRTDSLGGKVGSRRRLFNDPGGLPELQEAGLVAHHPRLGYYRVDAPPPELQKAKWRDA